ncbi:MAG: PEGA domain-containing protein [Defluviitaleaceae bacterium]|nr:PEGA domain-containing protein [Defluviitaleaceae bacterium]
MDEREKDTRKPIRREGAEYIPGGHKPAPDGGETRKISALPIKPPANADDANTRMVKTTPSKSSTGKSSSKKTPPKKTNYAIVMVTTVFVAVIAVVFVVVFLLRDWEPSGNNQNAGNQNSATNNNENINENTGSDNIYTSADPNNASWTGLIQNITGNRIDVFVFELNDTRSFFADGTSSLRDRLNNAVTITQFNVGDVIDITHPANSNNITTAIQSAETRFYREISGVIIDTDQNTLQIGSRQYNLQAQPIVQYRGTAVSALIIDPINVVTVGVFQDNYVTSINIHHSHGDITITSDEIIAGGIVEIETVGTGFRTVAPLEGEETTLRVLTGQNRISVRGEYIEPHTIETNVVQGANVTLSLDNLELRMGQLTVNTAVQDAIMFIGDRWFPVNEEIELPIGNHTIVIEAPGHQIFTQSVDITTTPQTINASLTAVTLMRPITFATNPPDARLYIDGVFRGITPLTLDLELGRHTVTILRMGFLGTQPTPIQVTMDSDDLINFMLHPDPAWPVFN